MALWSGSAINSNETAMLFNQIAQGRSVNIIRQKSGLLYAMMGEDDHNQTPGASAGFGRIRKVTGKNYEVRVLGKTVAPTGVADGSSEMATVDLSSVYLTDAFGAQEFAIAHYPFTYPIPSSELTRIKGDEAKTTDYLGELHDMLLEGYRSAWSTNLGATGAAAAPSRTKVGSWPFAIAGVDGTWTDGADDYGTIARDDSTNANFRGIVTNVAGTLTFGNLAAAKNQVKVKDGDASLGVAGETVYTKIELLAQSVTQAWDSDWIGFKGDKVRFAGIVFTLDGYAPSGALGLLTPKWWDFIYNEKLSGTPGGIVNDVSRVSTHVIQLDYWMQVVCRRPRCNAYLYGITG